MDGAGRLPEVMEGEESPEARPGPDETGPGGRFRGRSPSRGGRFLRAAAQADGREGDARRGGEEGRLEAGDDRQAAQGL